MIKSENLMQAGIYMRPMLPAIIFLSACSLFLLSIWQTIAWASYPSVLPSATVAMATEIVDVVAPSVADWQIFGEHDTQASTSPVIPHSSLNWALTGVLLGGASEPSAIIQIKAGEKLVTQGDKLPGDVEVRRRLPDRVILSSSGRLHALYLNPEQV